MGTSSNDGDDLSILGQFGFSDYTIEIYTEGHGTPGEIAYTHLHEATHQKLAHSTTFGALQTVLGVTSAASPKGPPLWAGQAAALLDESMEGSWTADEGYAVYSEVVLSRLLGFEGTPPALPDDYATAFEVYREIAARLPTALRAAETFVIDAVAQAAFNGDILAAWSPERDTAAMLRALLLDPRHRPDARLARFAQSLRVDHADAERLLATARRLAEEHGMSPGIPLDELARAAWKPANRALRDALLNAAGEIVAEAAARCCPELTILPPHRVRTQLLPFLADTRALLATYGVDFPEVVLAADADPMELVQAHMLGRAFERTTVGPRDFGSVPERCLRPGSMFVLQVGGHPFDPPERRGFFAHVFGRPIEGQEDDSTRSVQTVGGWDEIADAARRCAAHGGALLLVDASMMDPFRGGVWAPVTVLAEEIRQDVLVVAPSTFGMDVRDLLLGLRTVGVDALFEVAFLKATRVYVAGTRTGLAVLFPIPFTVAGGLQAHHPELLAWFTSVLGTGTPARTDPADDHPGLEVLRAAASLLLQGALTLSRPSWTQLRPA